MQKGQQSSTNKDQAKNSSRRRSIDGFVTSKHVRSTQKSRTLNRSSVAKPKPQPKAKPRPAINSRSLVSDKDRLSRASLHKRSPHIGKFAADNAVKTHVLPLSVAKQSAAAPPAYQPKAERSQSVFDRHFDKAVPHEQTKHKKSRLVALVSVPSLLIGLLIAGFVVYQQVPNVSMRLAASRAGFDASLPSTPAGFRIDGPIAFSNGIVTVNFASNSDQRAATLHQQVSSLDSRSLEAGQLKSQGIDYTEHLVNGQKIFIYDTSSATWVNAGVRYTLEGDSSLSVSQILDLVSTI